MSISDDGTVTLQFDGGTAGFGFASGIEYRIAPDNSETTIKSLLKTCESQRDHKAVQVDVGGTGSTTTACSRAVPAPVDVILRRNGEIPEVRAQDDTAAATFLRSLTVDVLAVG